MSLSCLLYIENLLLILCFILHIPLYVGQFVMWPVWQSALLWGVLFQPDNHAAVGLRSLRALALIVIALLSVYGALLTERIWWAGKDIHSTKALKSLFWVNANPLTFNNSSFWQQRASSGRVSGWACWARQDMAGICLSEWVSREPIRKPLNS